jgi:hypothetical protein
VTIHESILGYPIIESVHVLTLCVFLGLAVMLDLRLLGVTFRDVPVSAMEKRFLPWTIAGFAVMVTTGALLFYAIPVKTYLNIFFRIKVAFLLMAGVNVAVFHYAIGRSMADWETESRPPFAARVAGGLSLFFWATIVVCGRMIAYNWFDQ